MRDLDRLPPLYSDVSVRVLPIRTPIPGPARVRLSVLMGAAASCSLSRSRTFAGVLGGDFLEFLARFVLRPHDGRTDGNQGYCGECVTHWLVAVAGNEHLR